MSSYRTLGPLAIVPTGAMTGTSTITSQVFDCRSLESCAFAPVWTGTPTGTFNILVSLDYVPSPTPGASPLNAGTWNNLGASVSGNPAGTAGSTYIPVYASCTAFIQLQYVNSSGTGVLSGSFIGKTR
jgi:hypothetical protein